MQSANPSTSNWQQNRPLVPRPQIGRRIGRLCLDLKLAAKSAACLDLDLDAHYNWCKCDTLTGPTLGYWAVQAGLLAPLTSVHWLLLLPVRTFFTMEGGDSEFANFTPPTLKAFLESRSHVSGNKQ